ncbi:CGNR zinc finger domain-containing protein [Nocardia pseudobrasiliensis]|uniref:Putative stress-induced transcription regulator n=1 Tax=Nocardia pseudobrasiliensis TaxID=45979 RepID=A0A370IFL7_9NOCA|nr:CGNR zinc finger domain-containing protein [Nocardia pseudobrasiliensis]RDI69497.1 putative stress-induced transcription regulator [Nocardia pseudobrasiliensis]
MKVIESDETLLLDLLNTTPVVDGTSLDRLADADAGRRWLTGHGQPSSDDEWRAVRAVRAALQEVVRGESDATALARFVDGIRYRATFEGEGITWNLELPEGRNAAARAVLAWDALRLAHPGRLRPCANSECRLFLIDHTKSNSARWCSMAVCGNRMKARRHYQRSRETPTD